MFFVAMFAAGTGTFPQVCHEYGKYGKYTIIHFLDILEVYSSESELDNRGI